MPDQPRAVVNATRDGRWGIRQLKNGEPTGGGTVNIGWATYDEAVEANPPFGPYTFEAFDRYSSQTPETCIGDAPIKADVNCTTTMNGVSGELVRCGLPAGHDGSHDQWETPDV